MASHAARRKCRCPPSTARRCDGDVTPEQVCEGSRRGMLRTSVQNKSSAAEDEDERHPLHSPARPGRRLAAPALWARPCSRPPTPGAARPPIRDGAPGRRAAGRRDRVDGGRRGVARCLVVVSAPALLGPSGGHPARASAREAGSAPRAARWSRAPQQVRAAAPVGGRAGRSPAGRSHGPSRRPGRWSANRPARQGRRRSPTGSPMGSPLPLRSLPLPRRRTGRPACLRCNVAVRRAQK